MACVKICEHELKKGSEVDLYAELGATIAFDGKTERFVIKKIRDGEIMYSYPDLESVVRTANNLEGENNLEVGCDWHCPEKEAGA